MNMEHKEMSLPENALHIRKEGFHAALLPDRAGDKVVVHCGDVVVEGMRFATAFFGRGEFVPDETVTRDNGVYFRQELFGQYYQPLRGDQLQPVTRENWRELIRQRETSEECRLVYNAHIREMGPGIEIRVHAAGTDIVPLAVEIAFRPGGEFEGVVPAPAGNMTFLLREGYARYRVGEDVLRIGPGKAEHGYTAIRGAAAGYTDMNRLYFTGFTPFDHTFTLQRDSTHHP